jgi:hypothetical protein
MVLLNTLTLPSNTGINSLEAAAVSGTLRRLREENIALSLALGSAQTALNRAHDEMIEKRSMSLKRMEESKADAAVRISNVEKELNEARMESRRLARRAKQLEDELRASITDLNSAQADVRSLRSEVETAKREALIVSTSVSPRKIAVALVKRWKETTLIDSFTTSPGKIDSNFASSAKISSRSSLVSESSSHIPTSRSHITNTKAFSGLALPLGPSTETSAVKPPQVSRLLSKWTTSGALATSPDVFSLHSPSSSSSSSSTTTTTTSMVKATALNPSPRSSPLSLSRPPPGLPAPQRIQTPASGSLRIDASILSPTSSLSLQTQVDLLNAEVEHNGRTIGPLLVQLSTVLNDLHKAEAKIAEINSQRLEDQSKAEESAELISRLERGHCEMLLRVLDAEERANEAEATVKEFQVTASSDFLQNELLRSQSEYSEELANVNAELKKRSESYQELRITNADLQRMLQEENDISNELRIALEVSVSKQSNLKGQLVNVLEKLDDAFAKLAQTETSRADDAQHSSNELELASEGRKTMKEILENEARVHAQEIADAFNKQRLIESKLVDAQSRAERTEKKLFETQAVSDRVFASVEELQRRLSLALEELSRRNILETMRSQITTQAVSETEKLRYELCELTRQSTQEIRILKEDVARLTEQSRLVQSLEKHLHEAEKQAASSRSDADIEKSARLTLASSHEIEIKALKGEVVSLSYDKEKLLINRDEEFQAFTKSLIASKDEEIRKLISSRDATINSKEEESRRLYEALADSAERINVLRKKLSIAEERIQELQIIANNQKVNKIESNAGVASGVKLSSSVVSSSDWFSSDQNKK